MVVFLHAYRLKTNDVEMDATLVCVYVCWLGRSTNRNEMGQKLGIREIVFSWQCALFRHVCVSGRVRLLFLRMVFLLHSAIFDHQRHKMNCEQQSNQN